MPRRIRYEIRAITESDRPALQELAPYLDSVNLPDDASEIDNIISVNTKSFAGAITDPRKCEYRFLIWDLEQNRAAGTSMVLGQKGRRDAPYIYLKVWQQERYSSTLDKHFTHPVLEMRYSYKGPTEIGGIVVHPDYRRAPERLGSQISYVRFLWIAMHRDRFQDEVLAELMPPLEPDGTSHLWEAVGRRFTGMSYQEADKLSKRNKEFIRGLFPDGEIYATLLSETAQNVIGKVGPETRGVEKLLRRIGFQYAERVDPFDGGPHFLARTDEISLVEGSTRARVRISRVDSGERALVARELDQSPWFRCIATSTGPLTVDEQIALPAEVAEHLELEEGASCWVLPLH